MTNEKILDISWATLLKIAFLVLLFYILYQIKYILIWLIFALIISVLFEPAIDFFKKLRIPRTLAVSLVYVAFFGTLILIIYLPIPLFISEIKQLSQMLPQYFERISPPLKEIGVKAFDDLDTFLKTISEVLEKITANILNVLFVIFGGIFATIFILFIAIFISMEEKVFEKTITLFFPKKYEDSLIALWERCQKKVSGWFLARIVACLFVGIASIITFLLFNAPYPFSLGLLAGALNFIPIIGPLITGALLFIILALENISKAIFVLITFFLIQQVENNILSPFLLRKFVDLSPVLVLIAMAVGGVLFGFLGAVLAIPLAGILIELFKEFLEKRKEE